MAYQGTATVSRISCLAPDRDSPRDRTDRPSQHQEGNFQQSTLCCSFIRFPDTSSSAWGRQDTQGTHVWSCQDPAALFIAPLFAHGHGQGPYLPSLLWVFPCLKVLFTFDVYREKLRFATLTHKDVRVVHSKLTAPKPDIFLSMPLAQTISANKNLFHILQDDLSNSGDSLILQSLCNTSHDPRWDREEKGPSETAPFCPLNLRAVTGSIWQRVKRNF